MSRLLNLIRASKAVKEAQNLSRENLLKLQENRWRTMANYALQVSPFYRRHLAGIDVNRCRLQDIPPLTKELLLENWDEIVPDKRLRLAALEAFLKNRNNWGKLLHGRWMICMTSGTSGAGLTVPHDIAAVDWGHACMTLRNSTSPRSPSSPRMPLFRRRRKIIGFVNGADPSVSATIFKTHPWVGSLFNAFQHVDVGLPWNEFLEQVQRFKPDVLVGYSSLMGRLAQAKLNGESQLELPLDTGAIWAGGDTLTPGIRDLCRQAFGIEPCHTYGCGEVLNIARQWKGMDHLHVHDDMLVLEAVDKNAVPVPDGVLSDHALVTPLINKALPLLRYRINDRISFGPVHPHWPLKSITQLSGRSSMTYNFKTPGDRVFVGIAFLNIMEHRTDVACFQFRQSDPDAVECLVLPKAGADEAVLISEIQNSMRHCLDVTGCSGVKTSTRIVPYFTADPRTGKVEQNVPLRS